MRDVLADTCLCRSVVGKRLRPQSVRLISCAVAAMVAAPLHAQDAGGAGGSGRRELAIQPRISITETVSNNIELSQTQPLSDAVTELAAGVSFQSSSGRLRGFLDYQLSGFRYARHAELNTYQNALNANLGVDLVENRVKVDLAAGITQASLSAFGVQPGSSGLPASNLTEYRNFSITPSFNGPLGPTVQYKAGLTYSISDARGTSLGDSSNDTAFLRLSPSSPGVVGWSIDMTSLHSNFDSGRETVDNRMNGTLNRKIDALDLLVSASAGVEVTDLSTMERARYQNWGVGATWIPSPRTKVVAQFDERFFGKGHVLTFEHRTALTTWTFSDTRDLNSAGNGTSSGGRGATFDLYYNQFAAGEPDPVKRTDLVNSYLKLNNLSATTGSDSGYLRSGQTVTRGQNASVAYRGLRGAAVLTFSRRVDVPIDGAPLPSDDFVNTANVVTETVSISLSHRLTPASSVNLTVSYDESQGDRVEQHTNQREINLGYLTRLTDRSDLTAGARRSVFKNYQSPYNESAVFATFGHRF